MNSNPPISSDVPDKGPWPAAWAIWFNQVTACLPWKKAKNYVFNVDFGVVVANNTAFSAGLTIPGVRIGDAVHVTPSIQTNGIVYTANVTANDTVTLYANNITTGGINPPSTDFRFIVLQN